MANVSLEESWRGRGMRDKRERHVQSASYQSSGRPRYGGRAARSTSSKSLKQVAMGLEKRLRRVTNGLDNLRPWLILIKCDLK